MDSHASRRFDEQETSLILEQASRIDVDELPDDPKGLGKLVSPSTETGLTLAELQLIGEEAGISAAAVTQAATAILRGDHLPPERQTLWRLPVGVAKTVVFDRRLTDTEWERIVVLLRRTFGANGVVRGEGSLREWGNGRLRATLEPTAEGGHQLRLHTVKGDARMFNVLGSVFSILGLSLIGVTAASIGFDASAAWFGPIAVTAGGLAALARNALVLPRWFAERARQMTAVSAGASSIVVDNDPSTPRLPPR